MTAPPQHLAAFALGNAIRRERFAVKQRIAAADAATAADQLADLFADPPRCILTAPAVDVLCWPRYALYVQARRVLGVAGASEYRTVGDLTPRQRHVIALALRVGPLREDVVEWVTQPGADTEQRLRDWSVNGDGGG